MQSDGYYVNELVNGSYGGGNTRWLKDQAASFFGSIDNIKWAKAVMLFYDRYQPGWDDRNNWGDQYFFFRAAQLFKQYSFPLPDDVSSCVKVRDFLAAMGKERENAMYKKASGDDTGGNIDLNIINGMQSYVENININRSCTLYLTNMQQQQQVQTLTQVTDAAMASPEGTGNNSSRYVTWFIYGIAVLIVAAVIIKFIKH